MNLPKYREINKARRILGLPYIATIDHIKDAYHRLARQYHPDKCEDKNKDFCTKKMAEINYAYKLLMDYTHNYRYFLTEDEYKRQDPEYALKRFYNSFK
ncbi:MAG: DnaJ domain-containing protein [Deltaproteobacteria bacterium]|nr:DnaJ domain-containing protein [Deltaproteobacteria bacterium]MCL5791865.1 DnaJ domain-containing protein [Deltaproteobacteria bacterium]